MSGVPLSRNVLRKGRNGIAYDRYHAELLAHAVSGYDREALGGDYRLSTLWLMTRPIVQASMNIPPRVWWNNFERIMLAIDDLGCRDLLSI